MTRQLAKSLCAIAIALAVAAPSIAGTIIGVANVSGGGNAVVAWAVFAGNWAWILTLSLLALAISAFVRWGLLARAAMFGIFIVPAAMAAIVNEIFTMTWGDLLSLQASANALWNGLFRHGDDDVMPAAAGAVVLGLVCLTCVGLLARKVRAYEVVR